MGVALDEPTAIEGLYTLRSHGIEGGSKVLICRLLWLDFHGGGLVGEGADEAVSVAEL